MMQKKSLFVLGTAALFAVTLGCDNKKPDGAQADVAPKATASVESNVVSLPPPPKDDDVIASVGDEKLTWKELNAQVDELVAAYSKATNTQLPSEQLPQIKQEIRRQKVQEFISENIILGAAKKEGVVVDEAFRKARIAEIEKAQGMTFEEFLKAAPRGEAETRANLEKIFLAEKLLEEKVLSKVTVDPKEVEEQVAKNKQTIALVAEEMAGYKKQLADKSATFEDLVKANSLMKGEDSIPVSEVARAFPDKTAQDALLNTPVGGITDIIDLPGAKAIFKIVKRSEADTSAEEVAKKKAEDIRARLLKGEDFATLAKELSDCPSGKRDGGNLGSFGKGAMVPEFEKAAFEQKVNDIGPVVKTPFGYHIIKVTARDEGAGTVTASHILVASKAEPAKITVQALLKQVPQDVPAEQISQELLNMRKRDAVMKFFNEQRQQAKVTCSLFPELAAPVPEAPAVAPEKH